MQARALRVPELCDDHTPPSCLVTNSLAEPRYRSVDTLVLPDPLLTQGGRVTFLAYALHKLFVGHHGLCCSHVCACTHHNSLQHLLFCVRLHCPSVPIWMTLRTCGCFLVPQGGITPTTRTFRSQHHTLSNSYKLVRAPRPLCRYRLPHGSHMVQRLQALCLAHRLHTVPSFHRFRRAPLASSQVTLCQPRSLRLRRSSPLPHPWSVASLQVLTRRPRYPSPPHFWMPPRRPFHTSLSPRTFPHNSRLRSSPLDLSTRIIPRAPWLHLLCTMFSAPRVPDPSLRYFLTRLCRRLCSVASHDAATQLPLTEFFIGFIFSNDPLDRQGSSLAHCDAGSASLPQPADIATLCSTRSASHASDGHDGTTAPRVLPQSPPGLEKYAHLCASHCIPVKAAPVRPRLCASFSVTPPQPHVCTTQVGTHLVRSVTNKRSASTALAGTHNLIGAVPRAGTGPFPKPQALVLPIIKFGQSKPDGLGHIDTADSDLMHQQYRLAVLQWNPGPARRHSTNIIAAACGRFHAVILISDQFIAHIGNTDIAILLNKDTFELNPTVRAFRESSTSKGTWSMVLLIVRALLRRPSLSGSPTVTCCSVHIHSVVAKKRDASTDLLQRLHGYMKQHNVDFIGSDFNMSALSTVG